MSTDVDNAVASSLRNMIVESIKTVDITEVFDFEVIREHVNDWVENESDIERTVEEAVSSHLDGNAYSIVEDVLNDSNVIDDAVESFMDGNPEYMSKIVTDFFKSDEGKQIVRDVFASLVKEN